MRDHLRVAILALAIAVPSSLLASAGALANMHGDYTANGVNIRTGPGTGYISLGLGYTGQLTCTYYETDGQLINGSVQWFYHQNETTTVTGYSHSSFIAFDYPSQNC